MKKHYDPNAVPRSFKVGYKVLILLPLSGHPFKTRFHDSYEISRKVSDLNYIFNTPNRGMYHINMFKLCNEKGKPNPIFATTGSVHTPERADDHEVAEKWPFLKIAELGSPYNLASTVAHLTCSEREDITGLIRDFSDLFFGVPKQTNVVQHDVEAKSLSRQPTEGWNNTPRGRI